MFGFALLAATLLTACAGGSSPAAAQQENVGQLVAQPDGAVGSEFFFADSHFGGEASNLFVKSLHWGRLVNIADKSGVVMRDFVIASSIKDGRIHVPPTGGPAITYHLDRNPITDQYTLRIGSAQNTNDVTNEVTAGTPRFLDALGELENNLTPIFDNSLDANETGPFSMVPRNAAVVVVFSDLLEPVFRDGQWRDGNQGDVAHAVTGQLNKSLVKIRTGYPPVLPFETRVILDPNHGNLADRDGDGVLDYYSTRVIISATVSNLDSQASDPPLAVNSLGLPESLVPDEANLALRFPTRVDVSLAQTQVLRNAAGRVISYSGSGSTNNSTGTRDVVRALRSGGSLTQDPNNGFLLDEDLPSLLGDLTVDVREPSPYSGCLDCVELDLAFLVQACEGVKVGDLLSQNTANGQVNGVVRGWNASGTFVTNGELADDPLKSIVVEVLDAPMASFTFGIGGARLSTHYAEGDEAACFVRFSPAPLEAPSTGLQPNTTAFLLFSEPMDPATIRAFDSFTITQSAATSSLPAGYEYAVGRVVPTADLRTFRWDHADIPFNHVNGTEEAFTVTLASGPKGPRDLAGNPLEVAFEAFDFLLNPSAVTSEIGAFALRFENPGDDLFDDGLPEIRASQLIYDLENERILPRPVTRFSTPADTSQILPGLMTPFVGGIQTPLSNLGSKLQTVWRYPDVGFSLTDETNYNVDVEGISWSPVGGAVSTDLYDFFQIGLTHSYWLPDEILDPMSGFPIYVASGLKPSYAANLNDLAEDPMKVVHPKNLGYVVSAANLYNASSGTVMLPFPLNEDVAIEDRQYYTWRDTALLALGGGKEFQGNSGAGVPLQSERSALGSPLLDPPLYRRGFVPTVGLPLLMEFRCYSSDEALGLNSFDIALGVNTSPRPNFRAFSTGGYVGNVPNYVDPDDNDFATGGFNPNNGGAVTPGTDNTFYFGELGLVTRVSRVHSVFFDTGSGYTRFADPVVEPEANSQPLGTSVELAFRGAVGVPADILAILGGEGSAGNLDPYGNPIGVPAWEAGSEPLPIDFFGDGTWKGDISLIDSARYFQFRMSFISNAATGRTAELRTLAFAYFKTDPAP